MTAAADESKPESVSLHENAEKILMYLSTRKNDRASTSMLRDATGMSAANISGHHALTLIEQGYIEKVGTEEGNAPKDPNVYEITHRGRKEANRLLKENEAPMTDEERDQRVRQLRDRVEELERMVEHQDNSSPAVDDDLAEQVEVLETRLDRLEGWMERFVDNVDTLADKVNDLRKTVS